MSVYAQNLRALAARFPVAARRVEAARSQRVPLRSGEDARRIAARWLSGRRIRQGALLAVSGCGDGVHLRTLLSVLPAGARVFAVEASPERWRGVLEQVDLTDLLADPRLLVGTGTIDDPLFEAVTGLVATEITDIEPWIFAPGYNLAPEYYARFFTEFARCIDVRRKLEGTRIADAALWQANSFANLEVLADAPELPALAGVFRGRPMVLVSAGPSLDESLEFLRAASRVAVIAAVNSSYRAVRRAGIVPHLVLAADPREFTARGFAGVPVDGTHLVTTPIVHPDVPRMFTGRTFIWSGANELFLELRRRLKLPAGIRIVEQGTVSACAIDLAIILGCDRVCLVGQDLAIRADGRSHAEDTFYTDLNANRADTEECRRLPGNTLPEVLVESKLFIYLKTFEQLAVHRPQLKFINTSRLGARIEGMPYLPLDQALAWLGTRSTSGASEALAKRHAAGATHALGAERVRAVFGPTGIFARDILRLALRAAALAEPLVTDTMREDEQSAVQFAPALAAVDALRAHAAAHPDDYAVLEAGRARLELFKARAMENKFPPGAGATLRRFLADREYAWAMAEGAWFLLNQLDAFLCPPAPATSSAKIA